MKDQLTLWAQVKLPSMVVAMFTDNSKERKFEADSNKVSKLCVEKLIGCQWESLCGEDKFNVLQCVGKLIG